MLVILTVLNLQWWIFMDMHRIDDNEMLYRVLRKSYPSGFINGKPSAALFIDEKGLSVDRDGDRTEKQIINTFRERFGRYDDHDCAVKIQAGACRLAGTFPVPTKNKCNIFHAEIHESETQVPVSLSKAMLLAQKCQVVI